MKRLGAGKGTGKGYRNLIPHDRPVHRDSGRGIKQPQIKHIPPISGRYHFKGQLYPKRVSAVNRHQPNQLIDKIEFTTPVRKETAYGVQQDYGRQKQTMELFAGKDNYFIEWVVGDDLDYAEIGIWTENVGSKKVTDYDGVFELPKQAQQLLRKNGFDISEVTK